MHTQHEHTHVPGNQTVQLARRCGFEIKLAEGPPLRGQVDGGKEAEQTERNPAPREPAFCARTGCWDVLTGAL